MGRTRRERSTAEGGDGRENRDPAVPTALEDAAGAVVAAEAAEVLAGQQWTIDLLWSV